MSVERSYDIDSDRLFLVYYALPPGFNGNKWGVTESSIPRNIQSAVNKPVVIYRKNPSNPFHTKQAGAFVHPTPEEASAELGRINAEQYYNWQEKFAIGRVRNVDKREKGYAFTLEITDPEAKNILKSDTYRDGIPGWTSPQIISNGNLYPQEQLSEIYDHWAISHIALVDVPAYGKDQAGARASCLGTEQDCMITTRSASQENLGFCVRQATIDLINSRNSGTSLQETLPNPSHITMSQPETTNQPKVSETVTFTGTDTTTTTTSPSLKAETKQESAEKQEERERQTSPGQEDSKAAINENLSPKEQQMTELIREQGKQIKLLTKELDTIKLERKQARLSYIIPRDLFKSDESHLKEVQKAMQEDVPEPWLIEYWKTRRELAMVQQHSAKKIEEPLMAKSASAAVEKGHDVPDFSSSQNQTQRSNIQKQLELQRMILEGGAG